MHVDESTPLTEAERRYLLERGQDGKVAELDAKFDGWEADDEGDGTDEDQPVDYTTWTKAALKAEVELRVANGRVFELSAKPTVAEYAAELAKDDADGEDDE